MSLVPGNNTLAANLMARAWNLSTELHNVTNIGAAKLVSPEVGSRLACTLNSVRPFPRWEGKKNSSHQINYLFDKICIFIYFLYFYFFAIAKTSP